MFKYHKKVLKNGLKVLLVPMKNSESVTIQVLVGVGSKNETKKLNGISHFLEHMFFKGTKSRPNAGDIHAEIDKMGATHNAFTSKEITGYWVKASARDFSVAFDIVADSLTESLFKKEEIEKERGVILQEINMSEDMFQRKVINLLYELMYGDQPAGWSVLGTKDAVKMIKRADFIKYINDNYTAKNILAVVSGGIKEKEVLKEIEKRFAGIKKGRKISTKKTRISQKNPRVKFISKKTDQTHLAIGFRAYNMFDKRRYALYLLSNILGEKSSSRLFMGIREKLGLAYYVGSSTWLNKDEGFLLVRAGVSHGNLRKTTDKIMEILRDLRDKGVTKKELKEAKTNLRGQMALGFETTDQVGDFYGEQELFYGKIEQPAEILKKIEKVTQDDILKVARDIFRPKKISMAVIGSHKDAGKKEQYYKKLFSKI